MGNHLTKGEMRPKLENVHVYAKQSKAKQPRIYCDSIYNMKFK